MHTSFEQTSLDGHLLHTCFTPQPRSTALQPVTRPASITSAHVRGVQHPPSSQASLVPQVPQLTAGPQPLLTCPHVRAPHVGGVHAVHVPETHWLLPLHFDGQATLPLPHALGSDPHDAPPSAEVHSGGVAAHSPPTHVWPAGQEQAMVWPHPSVTVPHSIVFGAGVHVSGTHCPASTGAPASAAEHTLPIHAWPAAHPPQLIATPQASVPTTPHLPVQVLG
jgi:hypothetical protein